MLKWDCQPELRARSWAPTIKEQRIELDDVLEDNPGLKSRYDEALARAYRKGRLQAARETRLPEQRFPTECPYGRDDIAARPFEPLKD